MEPSIRVLLEKKETTFDIREDDSGIVDIATVVINLASGKQVFIGVRNTYLRITASKSSISLAKNSDNCIDVHPTQTYLD